MSPPPPANLGEPGADPAARALALARSGAVIAQGSTSIPLDWLVTRSPGLGVAVYPGGLLVKGVPYGGRTILAPEIHRVRWQRGRLFTLLAIDHAAIECPSPLLIRTVRDSALAAAIFQIAEGKAAR
jgi:hypothetical protein